MGSIARHLLRDFFWHSQTFELAAWFDMNIEVIFV
jgi:hypothetical protein